MKKIVVFSMAMLVLSSSTQARSMDIFTGPGGAQTVHNCQGVAMTESRYASSPATIHIIKSKLAQLGYATRPGDRFTKADTKSLKRFQRDQALTADGVVGPKTALALAYETAPNRTVANCLRLAMQ